MGYPRGYPIISYSILIYPIFVLYILERYPAFYPVMISYRISFQDILHINTYPNEITCEYILHDILFGILGYPENHFISNISYKDILHVILL